MSAWSTLQQRTRNKLLEKVTWYREKRRREDEDESDLPQIKRCRSGEEGRIRKREPLAKNQRPTQVKYVMSDPFTTGSILAMSLRRN